MIKYAVFLFMAVIAGALTYFEFPGASSQGSVRLAPDSSSSAAKDKSSADQKYADRGPQEADKERWIDRYLKRGDEAPVQRDIRDDDPSADDSRSDRSERDDQDWKTYIRLDDGEIVEVDGKNDTYRYTSDAKRRDDELHERNSRRASTADKPMPSRRTTYQTRDKKFAISMDEAAQISQPDLRDRAYMSIVEYASDEGLYPEAEVATSKIAQVELRDTARSTIAVSLARHGQSERAFELIDSVETSALQDVMRLQVIEATILPERRQIGLLNEPH